jgi:hypothetical protein
LAGYKSIAYEFHSFLPRLPPFVPAFFAENAEHLRREKGGRFCSVGASKFRCKKADQTNLGQQDSEFFELKIREFVVVEIEYGMSRFFDNFFCEIRCF